VAAVAEILADFESELSDFTAKFHVCTYILSILIFQSNMGKNRRNAGTGYRYNEKPLGTPGDPGC
jgi:hypothetical protein